MKPLAERQADRAQRKFDNQGQEAIDRDEAKGLGRAGIGVVNRNITGDGFENAGAGNGGGSGWPQAQSGEPGPLDGSIADLATHLEGVSDPAEVDRLITVEQGGKNRQGALQALNDRKTALGEPQSA